MAMNFEILPSATRSDTWCLRLGADLYCAGRRNAATFASEEDTLAVLSAPPYRMASYDRVIRRGRVEWDPGVAQAARSRASSRQWPERRDRPASGPMPPQ